MQPSLRHTRPAFPRLLVRTPFARERTATLWAGFKRMKTVVSVYSITMGALMLALWLAFWAFGAIPDMMQKPWEIAMHLTAEFTTAGLLIASGIGLILEARWATRVNVFASGMLVYSLIQSPGYYLQKNAMIFVTMFAVAFLITVVLSPAFKSEPDGHRTAAE
jgi:hypothetical protein